MRALAAKPSDDQTGVTGQLGLFREFALGNFRDLLLRVSQDPAMVAWLDGDTNLKDKPQENYARELMELFTMGVAFYTDLENQGLLNDVLVLQFSEFGRRVSENGSSGTDHGSGGLMMAIGGRVAGGLYGTAASLADTPDNPTLENSGRDVKYETDFRSVYARVIDDWLGASSVSLLGGDFRNAGVDFV